LAGQDAPVELCYFGGSFARVSRPLMIDFLDAANAAPMGSTITFSSYPGDFDGGYGLETIATLKKYPIETIELGIPSMDSAVLERCGRGGNSETIELAVKRLRDNGFHLGIQMMIGLPGQTEDSVMSDISDLASLMPAGEKWSFRLYPCLVLEGTELEAMYRRGEYRPLELEEAARMSGKLMLEAEYRGFNVIRVGLPESESLKKSVLAGPYHPAFGELALSEKTALSLFAQNPQGPWVTERKNISHLTGHGARGIRRLAELSGMKEKEARALWHSRRLSLPN
jgi:histone acetyltransferase (RNA polymerase elongator complex component)